MRAINATEEFAIVTTKILLLKYLSVALFLYVKAASTKVFTYSSLFETKGPRFTGVTDIFHQLAFTEVPFLMI